MISEEPVFTSGGDGTWVPHEHGVGPWNPNELHGGAVAALLARAVEQVQPGGDMIVTRLTYEFFGAVPLAPFEVHAELAKPGKRVQIVQAAITAEGREVMRVRAMRMRRAEQGIEAGPPASAPLPPPEVGEVVGRWHGAQGAMFHPSSIEIRLVGGGPGTGASTAWFRLVRPIVGEETPTGLQRLAAAADFTLGISHVVPFDEALFANTDLTIVAHRDPVGEWIALDARSDLDGAGVGQSVSILHDEKGRIGAAAQSLYVEPRSA